MGVLVKKIIFSNNLSFYTKFENRVIFTIASNHQLKYQPEIVSNFQQEIKLSDHSERAIYWNWFFDDQDNTIIHEPSFIFSDTGKHQVKLIVTDIYGCEDTIKKIVDVIPQNTYFLPNAFTPNNDGKNEFFLGKGRLDGITNFKLSIWDRWGQKIYETSDPYTGWNGRYWNNGQILPNGVFTYFASFTAPRGELNQLKGFVTLIR